MEEAESIDAWREARRSGALRGSGVRAAVRLVALVGVTAALFSAFALSQLVLLPSARGRHAARAVLFRRWARSALRITGTRLRLRGHAPPSPCLVVSNHLSYLDAAVLASELDALYVAKADVADWPVVGFLSRQMGTVFVDRERKRDLLRVIGLLEDALRAGRTVAFFPEGTSSAGCCVLPFRSALFEASVRSRVCAAVASLRYETPHGWPRAEHSVCWWGDMTFARHVLGLLRLPWIEAELEFGSELLGEDDRKQLARRAHAALCKQFRPVVQASQRG